MAKHQQNYGKLICFVRLVMIVDPKGYDQARIKVEKLKHNIVRKLHYIST